MTVRSWAVAQVFEVSDEAAEVLVTPLRQALRAQQAGPAGGLLEDHDVKAGAEVRARIGEALAVLVVVTAGDRRRARQHGQRVLRAVFQAAAADPRGPLTQVPAAERTDAAERLYETAAVRLTVKETLPGVARQLLGEHLGVDLIRAGIL
ncbi:hypothetical protein [Pseudonocardia sp. ICBG1293]|uniref:hypothetical protein n=1 Tax=Pseudonocardia sp. ICBG1293 TaxID=2844382 RepID=UPI001CCE8DA3|nr:hypothetical protein [Pseudonocardia sp. ICBG1293]